MDFFTTELRDKPVIGMVSGLLSWIIYQVNTVAYSGFFSDHNPIWAVSSKIGIIMGLMVATLTFFIKLKEFIEKYFPKK